MGKEKGKEVTEKAAVALRMWVMMMCSRHISISFLSLQQQESRRSIS